MKILHVVPGMRQNGGGVSESVPNSCRALAAAGHEVTIAVCEPDSVSDSVVAAEREGVKVCRFSGNVGGRNPILFSWGMFRGLERLMRDCDVVHLRADWLFPIWWGARLARKLGKPYVMQPHGSFAPERLRISAWKKRPIGFLFEKPAVRGARAVIGTCEAEAAAIRAYVPGTRTVIIPNGMEVGLYGNDTTARAVPGHQRTLLYFSRISQIKGLDLLAEAWAKVDRRGWKLLLVGPDDHGYTDVIKKVFAEKCEAGSFEFRAPVYGEEKVRLLDRADAFVLPTRNENWGNAVAEAMASRLPVICTKGAPWECLEKTRSGRWVDVSVEGIAQGLEDVLSLDDRARMEMGERGRKWVLDNLDWAVIAAQMEKVYTDFCLKK